MVINKSSRLFSDASWRLNHLQKTLIFHLKKRETVDSGGRWKQDISIEAHRNCLNSLLICPICSDSKSPLLSVESELRV